MDRAILLILAMLLDALIGDPPWLPHPVRLIGKAIERGERWLRIKESSPGPDFFAGLCLVVGVVCLTYLLTEFLLSALLGLSWWLGQGVAVVLGSLCLARCGLKQHALAVFESLKREELGTARVQLARMVSRETTALSQAEMVRGTVESVAENTSDGVIAPLFYLALGGVPLALAYKAVNTLDSMVGYHTERYEYFGKAAARFDDVVNLLPARLTAVALVGAAWLCSAFTRGCNGAMAWRIAWRDGHKHASPNAGYPEAAMAGALGVQLGGPSRYFGVTIEKPTLGDARRPLTPALIPQSAVLLDVTSALVLLALVIAEYSL